MTRFLMLSTLLAVCLSTPAFAQRYASFAGRWTGTFENSLGERGQDSLDLSEDQDGNLTGMWTGNVRISGKRIDDATAELHGRTDTRGYRIFLTARRDELTLKYTARRLNSSGEYEGEARFTRAR
jgi:hypothetical protein